VREGRRVFLAAQHRIGGPLCGPFQFGTRNPADPRVQAGFLEDRFRELGPGDITFRSEVPDTERPLQ
jgi:hypothetical protein